MSTFCHFCTGCTTFQRVSAKYTSFYKTAFPARAWHVLSFSHWAQHFLPVLSKVREFVQNRVFSPRSGRFVDFAVGAIFFAIFRKVHKLVKNWVYSSTPARFLIFALGAPLSWRFQQSTGVWYKTAFLDPHQHVLSFLHRTHHFFAVFSKVCDFVQNSVFSPRSARFVIFALGYQFLAIVSKVHEFVQNSVSSARSARFVIFPLGTTLFSSFDQTARLCTKPRIQREIRTFCDFVTGHNTFSQS